jgi:hypothetical protein
VAELAWGGLQEAGLRRGGEHAAVVLRWKVGDGGGVPSLVGQGEEDVFPLFRSFDMGDNFCFWKPRDEGRSTDRMYILRIIKAYY